MDLELGAELVSLLGLSGEVLPLTLLQNVLPIRNSQIGEKKLENFFAELGTRDNFLASRQKQRDNVI